MRNIGKKTILALSVCVLAMCGAANAVPEPNIVSAVFGLQQAIIHDSHVGIQRGMQTRIGRDDVRLGHGIGRPAHCKDTNR